MPVPKASHCSLFLSSAPEKLTSGTLTCLLPVFLVISLLVWSFSWTKDIQWEKGFWLTFLSHSWAAGGLEGSKEPPGSASGLFLCMALSPHYSLTLNMLSLLWKQRLNPEIEWWGANREVLLLLVSSPIWNWWKKILTLASFWLGSFCFFDFCHCCYFSIPSKTTFFVSWKQAENHHN